MIRFLLILGIMGAFGYFGYSIVAPHRAPKPASATAAANMFVQAAVDNNMDWVERLCEPGVSAHASGVAGQIRPLITSSVSLKWQVARSTRGQRAVYAPIAGQRTGIIVEVNQHGSNYKIANVGLVATQ